MATDDLEQKTISDFGDQWTFYTGNEGFYGSLELLQDILGPALLLKDLNAARVAEIGSGTGRIAQLLLQAGVAHVVALEPSRAVTVLRQNLSRWADQLTVLQTTGDKIPPTHELDYVFCIGVLHHIPNPLPTLKAAHAALKSKGKLVLWVYGRETGGIVIGTIQVLRIFSKRMPDWLLRRVCRGLRPLLQVYIKLSFICAVPLRDYARNVLAKLDLPALELIIYDQLNPAYAKYYTRRELEELLIATGFGQATFTHRHGYSWTVIAEPQSASTPPA